MNMLKKATSRFNHFIKIRHPENGAEFKVNAFWLRDHCRCKECYSERTHQITSDLLKLSADIQPVQITQNQELINIVWNDEHVSQYSIPYLYSVLFQQKKHKPLIWNKTILKEKLKNTIAADSIFNNKKDGRKDLLINILKFGVGFVNGVEPTMSASEKLMNHIAPLMDSVFDKISVISSGELQHDDFAYTNIALEAHNDTTYWIDAAGLEMFHVLSHDGDGGETLLVDGFNAAEELRRREPEAFKVLCMVPVSAEFIDKKFHYTATDSVLKVNPISNELIQIRYNIRDRAVLNTIPQSDVGLFYEAYKLLGEEINKQENQYWVKLQPGTLVIIDNWRVLHGRSAFTGARQLCSCYISRRDWTNTAKMLGLL